jgi:hypothetical protein
VRRARKKSAEAEKKEEKKDEKPVQIDLEGSSGGSSPSRSMKGAAADFRAQGRQGALLALPGRRVG